MSERVDCVVIGAGVVGLAVARALAMAGRDVIVLESETAIGTATSSRNSEVIHAGLYYASGSLKAKLCVQGKALLYDYCEQKSIAYRRCGKLIVAADAGEVAGLHHLQQQALANGVVDTVLLDQHALRALEPTLQAVAALHSPSTGIVDSHGLMLALQGDAEAAGAMIAFASPVLSGQVRDDGIELNVGGDAPMQLLATTVVNSAGLWAPRLAAQMRGLPPEHVPRPHFCKGSYFSLTGKTPFKHLIYPLHNAAGLGVHLTLDLGGQARFGPDTEWLADDAPLDYAVDPRRGEAFVAAIRRYWPALPDGALSPSYSGVRPKIVGPGEPAADFVISGPAQHGVTGLVNLFGIESPGLTACLAIADEVTRQLRT